MADESVGAGIAANEFLGNYEMFFRFACVSAQLHSGIVAVVWDREG